MAQARKEFMRVQRGVGVTWGTGVAATSILAGLTQVRYKPDNAVEEAAKLDGSLAVSDGVDTLGLAGMAVLNGWLTYEDFPFLLESGYKTATPTADAGTPISYARVYAPTLNDVEDVPKFVTLEMGSNVEKGRIPSALVRDFEINAAIRAFTSYGSNWFGNKWDPTGSFTAALTRRLVERIKGQLWKVYIDTASSGTMGTTEVTSCVTAIQFRSGPLYGPRHCMNGSLEAAGYAQMGQKPEATVTFQQSAETTALLASFQADEIKYIRLKNEGSIIHDAVRKSVQIDLCGAIADWPEQGDSEGENALTVPVRFTGVQDKVGSFAKLVQYTVVNKVATLP
jgi:hypothetical protein